MPTVHFDCIHMFLGIYMPRHAKQSVHFNWKDFCLKWMGNLAPNRKVTSGTLLDMTHCSVVVTGLIPGGGGFSPPIS